MEAHFVGVRLFAHAKSAGDNPDNEDQTLETVIDRLAEAVIADVEDAQIDLTDQQVKETEQLRELIGLTVSEFPRSSRRVVAIYQLSAAIQ